MPFFLGASRLQVFHKGGYKHSICPYGAWCGALSGIQLQTSGEPSILGAQELIKEAATVQGWALDILSSFSQHPLFCVPSWHSAFPGGRWKGSWSHCFSKFCVLRVHLAHTELRYPQLQGYLASGIRPGKRKGLRRMTSLASGSRSSVATATTVPACVGVLTVPKLGPPAQYLIGAVLPTATGHAGRRVIDFKLQCFSEELIGAMIVFKYS